MSNKSLRKDVDTIINQIITDINPYDRTVDCVKALSFGSGRKILVSIGKAAWSMGKAVCDAIRIDEGVIITKYGYSNGDIENVEVYEAGHPIVDENSIIASECVLNITSNLNENDEVILCISGGGSALFEKPFIDLESLQNINNQLIKSGASINEINIIRKKLSTVKGGKFALHCSPAHINAIILSDVVGNDLGSIASGPVSIDTSTPKQALDIIEKYNISISDNIKEYIHKQENIQIDNVNSHIIGSVEQLCAYTKKACEALGYHSTIIQSDCVDDVSVVEDKFRKLITNNTNHNEAYIIGGESVVHVKGNGLGGRNSELALRCSEFIKDYNDACFFAFGSDGTDGPTDAAGGYVDCETYSKINVDDYLENNDSYHALEITDGLIKTGPTGSNVNDVYVLLIR